MFTDSNVHHNVWIPEPRWSWYGTPIWRTMASVLRLRSFEPDPGRHHSTGAMTSKDLRSAHIAQYSVYFTDEEYVMFKLEDIDQQNEKNIGLLRQGIIYS